MEQKFKKTDEILKMESEIKLLRDSLEEKRKEFKEKYQVEFDKQFNLVKGKTIVEYKDKKYVYVGLCERLSFSDWISGCSIKKDGSLSKNQHTLYNEWKKTNEEYNV